MQHVSMSSSNNATQTNCKLQNILQCATYWFAQQTVEKSMLVLNAVRHESTNGKFAEVVKLLVVVGDLLSKAVKSNGVKSTPPIR